MTDINLLPLNEREKEFKEAKRKAVEKSRLQIELARPLKEKTIPGQAPGSFWLGLKQELKDIFKKWKNLFQPGKKELKVAPEKITHPAESEQAFKRETTPQVPKHFDDIKIKEKKEFFYQSPATLNKNRVKDKIGPVDKESRGDKEKMGKFLKVSEKPQPSKELVTNHNKLSSVKIEAGVKESRLDINLIPTKIKAVITTKGRIKILVGVIIICLLLSFASYLLVNRVLSNRQIEIKKIDGEIQVLTEKINILKKTRQGVNEFVSLLREAEQLLEQHIFVSQILSFLQEHTLQQIYYSDMKVDSKNMSIDLTAKAKDYKTLAEQLLVFQSQKEVAAVEINEAQLEKEKEKEQKGEEKKEELITFNLTLKLKPYFYENKR